ncbi:MAG: hypothetical protein ACO1N9_00005, partial [Flavobacterium sp.]
MKHLRHLLLIAAVLLTTALLIQCAKDDAGLYDDARQFGPEMQQPVEYLKGAKKAKAIKLLKDNLARAGKPGLGFGQMSATARDGGWTIDFDEVLLVTDSIGNRNYTYRVNHPQMATTVFYNLVLTESETRTTIKLVKYNMTPRFTELYYARRANIANFAGTIIFDPIADNPRALFPDLPDPPPPPPPGDEEPDEPVPPTDECDEPVEVVIPDPPADSGGNGGPSSGTGPIHSLDEPTPNTGPAVCWEWRVTKCTHNLHSGEVPECPSGYSGPECCSAPQQGSTILVNRCNGQVINPYGRNDNYVVTDACDPVGEIGVLPPKIVNKNNCDELKKLSENDSIKNNLLYLKTKTTDTKEYGYGVKKGSSNYNGDATPVQSDPNHPNNI